MITKPNKQLIRQFDNVILANMQRNERSNLSWRDVKRICKDAIPSIDVYRDIDPNSSQFIHSMLGDLENLENNGLVTINRRGKFILRIDLTERGKDVIKNTEFIQEKH